ncbi:CopL family metal-binding regulatory protein [Xanthomonas hortorum]|uniref:CopL family metal-binding regulatory protein n=1 Tax=Xanthomonas TaxID=338 RepID=UPI0020CE90D6|nr:CopL family metal-binding regulatory protein [Xanthomonas hortorum]UTS75027.1 CopL family metal-binding regulatory protein [Xanthomonas hortorum]
MLRCLLRLLLCLCLVANTATGAWASVGMAMPAMASGAMAPAASAAQASMPAAMPCHADMQPTAAVPTHDNAKHAHAADCCKLGSCDCLQHCSLALLTLPAVPAGLLGHWALPADLAEGRSSPVPEQPVRPPIA